MRQPNPADRARLVGAARAFNPDLDPDDGLRECVPSPTSTDSNSHELVSLAYVASSDVTRAGGAVRLEL